METLFNKINPFKLCHYLNLQNNLQIAPNLNSAYNEHRNISV